LAETEQVICGSCNLGLPRTGFAEEAYDNELAQLFWGRLPIERAAAWFYYQAQSEVSQVIYELKYRNHPEIGEQLGRMMAEELQCNGFFEGIDLMMPVPLTRMRKWKRGYNQSEEIARGIQQVTSLPIVGDVLKRNRYNDSQTRKNRWQRTENVEGAFCLCNADKVRHRHVLIVDDVVTTGATVYACGKELMKAEGVRVSVLALGYSKG